MPEETVEKKGTPEAGIIVVSHADYGSAILRTAEFILGPLSDCTSISVDVGQEVPRPGAPGSRTQPNVSTRARASSC